MYLNPGQLPATAGIKCKQETVYELPRPLGFVEVLILANMAKQEYLLNGQWRRRKIWGQYMIKA